MEALEEADLEADRAAEDSEAAVAASVVALEDRIIITIIITDLACRFSAVGTVVRITAVAVALAECLDF